MTGDGAAAQLERVGQLAGLDGEGVIQEGEALDLLEGGEVLLGRLDEGAVEADDLLAGDQVAAVSEGDGVAAGVGLEGVEGGHDKGADELALVGNDGALLGVGVAAEAHLDRLRGDVFAVRCLEEILDALQEEERVAL